MNYEQREAILSMVEEVVRKEPAMLAMIIARCTQGLERRVQESNEMRTNAEFALCSLFDMVPKSKLDANPALAVKTKKILLESGSFAGTIMAKEFEKEIMASEEKIESPKDIAK